MTEPLFAYAVSASVLCLVVAVVALFRLGHARQLVASFAQVAAERQARIADLEADNLALTKLRDDLAMDLVDAENIIARWVPKRGPKGHFLKPSTLPTT